MSEVTNEYSKPGVQKMYHPFARTSILPVEFYNMSLEDVQAIEGNIKTTKEHNAQIRKENREAFSLVIRDLKKIIAAIGMSFDVQTKTRGTKVAPEFSKTYEAISARYMTPEPYNTSAHECKLPDGSVYRSYVSPVTLTQLWKQAHDRYRATEERKKVDAEYFKKAMEWCVQHNYIAQADNDIAFIKEVTEEAKRCWLEENYPPGTQVGISFCDDCTTYEMGEHRCSCGNVRVYVEVEGMLGNFYAVPYRN